jgi:putative endonuclease
MKRQEAERRGRLGEGVAAWWLRLHGWRILGSRMKTKLGEVDIVARRGRMIAFVEVKTRRSARELDTAIDAYRLRRVAVAARLLAPRYQRPHDDIRIDVILLAPWNWPRHLTNVWTEN